MNGREFLVLFHENSIYLDGGKDVVYNEPAFSRLNKSLEENSFNRLTKPEIKKLIETIRQKGTDLLYQEDRWARCLFDVEPIEKHRYKVYLEKSEFLVLVAILIYLTDKELEALSAATTAKRKFSDVIKERENQQEDEGDEWSLVETPPRKD